MFYLFFNPRASMEDLGFIPGFLSEDDPRPAAEQIDTHYQHGGGWNPMPGWTRVNDTLAMQYPGDPPMKPFAVLVIGEERVFFYPHAFVCIVQKDGSFEMARVD